MFHLDACCRCRFCAPLLSPDIRLNQRSNASIFPRSFSRCVLPLLPAAAVFNIWLNQPITCRISWFLLLTCVAAPVCPDVLDTWLNSTPKGVDFELHPAQTLRSVKSDVTRHRYGDEAHLDTTVKFLGLVLPQSDYPQLQYISQVRLRTLAG